MIRVKTLLAAAILSMGLAAFALTEDPGKVSDKVWLNNKLGLGHEVPPPWTPVQAKDNTVSVWGRKIILSGSGFPEQIINQGQPMLCSPLVLKAVLSSGRTIALKPGKVKLLKKYSDHAIFAGVSSGGGISAKVKTTVEFDGFNEI